MIKKILLMALCIVLLIGLVSAFLHGVNISIFGLGIHTDSYSSIIKKSQDMVSKREQLEKLNDRDFVSKKRLLDTSISSFENAKAQYDDVANHASVEEIRKANQDEEYALDYLWMKIGTYANDSDIKVKILPDANKDTIHFDVSGQYIAIINFIYDLENDSELKFNVDNIVMQGGSSSAVTKASFTVEHVHVITGEVEE